MQCQGGGKQDGCLSAGQVQALKTIWAGPHNSRGQPLYTDWQWDPGLSGINSLRVWALGTPAAAGQPLVNNARNITLAGSLPLVFVTPPAVMSGDDFAAYLFHFNFDTDAPRIYTRSPPYDQPSMEFMTANSPERFLFRQHGGKMIIYHGDADIVFSPHDTIGWYNRLNFVMGGTAADFVRLFLVPGMGHCSAGPSTSAFDAFQALVNWVEQGAAPSSIVATAPAATPWPGRTRPLCAYPTQARYTGQGSIEDAANFTCVAP